MGGDREEGLPLVRCHSAGHLPGPHLLRLFTTKVPCHSLVRHDLGTAMDALRLRVPVVRRNWPLGRLLRDWEQNRMCGGTYFSFGCSLCMHFSTPAVAEAAILFLVVGDMSA